MSAPDDRTGPDATPPGSGEGRAADAQDGGHAAGQGEEREEQPGSASLAWRGAKRFVYGVGGLLLTILLLVALALLLLQTEWGSRVAKNLILAQVNPIGEARLEIDDIDGNWISSLELKGVRLIRPAIPSDAVPAAPSTGAGAAGGTRADSVRLVQIDSLKTDFRLLGLLDNRVHLSGVRVYRPDVRMAQQEDGSWDLFQPFVSDTTDSSGSPWTVRLDSVEVQRGQLDARFYTPSQADSTLRVRDLEFFADDMDFGGPSMPRINVRNLSARFTPPGQTLERRFAFSGALDERQLAIDSLRLDSPYSNVSGEGTLVLPGADGGPVENIDFQLSAQPLDFRDLAGFVANIDPDKSVRLDLRATGTSERLQTTLDAAFSDGATANVSGTVLTGVGGAPLGADLEGRLRQFDPGFLTPGPRTGSVNGDFSADLNGRAAETLEGTLAAELFDTRFGEYLLSRTRFGARFLGDGSVAIDGRGGLRGATFAVDGTVRPFDDPRAYDLGARFQNVDLARFSSGGEGGATSDLDGRLTLQGYGTSLADANVTAQLLLDGSRVNRFQINEGDFDVRLIDGKVNLGARVRSPQGAADVRGSVWLTEEPLRYRINQGRIDDVDVAALAGDTTRSSLTGTFRLAGRGTNPQGDLRLDVAALQLENSYYGPYVINSTNLDVTLANGRVDVDGQADLDGGTFDLADATIYPFGTQAFSVGRASFSNVDIGRLGQYPGGDITQSSDLNGTVSLEGRGFQPQTMYLTGTARLDSSRLNDQIISEATVDLTLDDGVLAVNGALDVPEGQTRLAATIRPFGENPSFSVEQGSTFSGINVGALAGIEGLDTDLRGEILALEGTGFSLDELRGNARIDLTGSRVNDAVVSGGTLGLDIDGGVTDLVADLTFEDGGRADLNATLDRSGEVLSYRAEGTLDRFGAGALLGDAEGIGALNATLNVEGRGTDPRTAVSRGRLDLAQARVGDIELRRLLLDYALSDGLLVVDTLRLNSNVAEATGGGTLALYDPEARYATDFRLAASVDSLGPVRPFVSDSLEALAIGENQFDGRLTGQPGGPLRLTSDVNIERLVYGDVRVASFSGAASATTEAQGGLLVALDSLSVEALRNAQVRGDAGYVATNAFATREASFDAVYGGDEINLEARVKVDQERDIRLAGVLDPRPEARRIRLDTLNVRFGPDRWKLLQDATISYGDQYRVSGLLLYTEDGQQIAADGTIDFDSVQNFVLTLEDFRLGAVADLAGLRDLAGTASGDITLRGPADSPELGGALTLDVESGGNHVGDLRIALDYANERLGIDAAVANDDQSTLTAEGYLPLDLRLVRPAALSRDSLAARLDSARAGAEIGETGSPVDIVEVRADTLAPGEVALSVQADSFAVDWLRPFLDAEQVSELGGRIAADIDIGGTLAAPRVAGTASFTNGSIRLASLGTTYDNIRADLLLTGDQVRVREAVAESGGGRLTATGTVNLAALTLGELNLTIGADEFRAVATDGYRATTSGTLTLGGTTEAPELGGSLSVRDADIYLDAFTGGGTYGEADLTDEDLQALRENFGVRLTAADTSRSQVYQALAMDLNVEIERDTWLRSTANPELDVQLEGDLDVEKASYADLQLFGTIEVVPERSRVVQFGRRFEIANGVVTFNGLPSNPSIDLEAEYNVRSRRSRGNEATITLSVNGQPGDLNFELGSDPSMETSDILSYIAVGKPAGAARQGGEGSGAESLATGAVLGQLSTLVEGIAGDQGLGLDVFEFELDSRRGTVLTAGEYVYLDALPNPLFVAISQPLTGTDTGGTNEEDDETEVTLEYEVTEGLLVRLFRRESIRLNLRFEYAY